MSINWKIKVQTKRFVIRPLTLKDESSFLQSCKQVSPPKNPWDLGRRKTSQLNSKGFRSALKQQQKRARSDECYIYHIFGKYTGEHLGAIDFKNLRRDKYVSCVNLGYSVHNHLWGRGIAREAIKAFYKIAFTKLKFHRIEASMDPKNIKSQKVARAAGFKYEGIRYGGFCWKGKWMDLVVYSKVNSKKI